MFTGIIENIALVKEIKKDGDNLIFTFESDLTSELKIDQSISHNGICLTVFDIVDSNIEAASKASESVVSQPVGKAKGKKAA